LKASQECEEEDFEGIIDSLLEFNSSINVLCSEVSLVSFKFEVEVEKIRLENQKADILTKDMPFDGFRKVRRLLCG